VSDKPNITDETPLRLAVAAEVAFPGGGMTASGLRKEAGRGRLVIERIAGKDYTTLAAIAEMRRLCRIQPTAQLQRRQSEGYEPQWNDQSTTERVLCKLEIVRGGPVDLKERLHAPWAELDKQNRARPFGKRERDALCECFEARGTAINLQRHWPRTALWLVLHGLIKPKGLDQDATRIYSITPAGESEWQRIQDRQDRGFKG
jgi:hypothetical protein